MQSVNPSDFLDRVSEVGIVILEMGLLVFGMVPRVEILVPVGWDSSQGNLRHGDNLRSTCPLGGLYVIGLDR